MGKQREFYDKPLFSLLNHISWLLLGGIYFILLNIPLIFFFTVTSIDINQFSIVLLFICLIPFGLALGALYSTMGEIIREKDISFSSYFFRAYKNDFKSNLKVWLLELMLLTLFFVDYQYFYLNMPNKGLHIIFLILGIFVLILGLYAFPINCRFNIKLKALLKIAITLLAFFIVSKIHAILVLFIPSILCYLLTMYDRPIFNELEQKFLSQNKATGN